MKRMNSDGEWVVDGYLVPNPNFIVGVYNPTALDEQKKQADILLTSIDGGYYSLRVQKQIEITGRGVRQYSNGIIVVPHHIYEKLESRYDIMCDF